MGIGRHMGCGDGPTNISHRASHRLEAGAAEKVSVFVSCGNRLVGESIARILNKKADLRVIADASNCPAPGSDGKLWEADVVVLDSLRLMAEISRFLSTGQAENRNVKCILIGMVEDKKQFLTAVREGAMGYVLGEASASDIVAAIRSVAQGEAVCPPRLTRVLFDYLASQSMDNRTCTRLGLTRRETQLIPLIGRGLTNKEIANQLYLSEQTVKNHIHRILQKVGAEDRLSAFETCQTQAFSL